MHLDADRVPGHNLSAVQFWIELREHFCECGLASCCFAQQRPASLRPQKKTNRFAFACHAPFSTILRRSAERNLGGNNKNNIPIIILITTYPSVTASWEGGRFRVPLASRF